MLLQTSAADEDGECRQPVNYLIKLAVHGCKRSTVMAFHTFLFVAALISIEIMDSRIQIKPSN